MQHFIIFCLLFHIAHTRADNFKLSQLYISHGALSPPFSPDIHQYRVDLPHFVDYIDVTPLVDNIRTDEGGPTPQSLITLYLGNEPGQNWMITVQRNIPLFYLPNPAVIKLKIACRDPACKFSPATYVVTIHQPRNQGGQGLRSLIITNEADVKFELSPPIINPRTYLYETYVDVSEGITYYLQASCLKGNSLTVNKAVVSSGTKIPLKRDPNLNRDLITVTCSKNSVVAKYSILVNYVVDEIPTPALGLPAMGQFCNFVKDAFFCPAPRTDTGVTTFIAETNPIVRYSIETADQSAQACMLNESPTMPLPYHDTSQYRVIAVSGKTKKIWPVYFMKASSQYFFRAVGYTISVCLGATIILYVLFHVWMTLLYGFGRVKDQPQQPFFFVSVCQILWFMTHLQDQPPAWILGITDHLRWTTWCWGVPSKSAEMLNGTNLMLWQMNDDTGLPNMHCWSLIWMWLTLFGMCFIRYLYAIMYFRPKYLKFSVPKSLLCGMQLEQSFLQMVSVPCMVWGTSILSADDLSWHWKLFSGISIAGLVAWIVNAYLKVDFQIKWHQVVWMQDTSQPSGAWQDAYCTELMSAGINRSVVRLLHPFVWETGVAEIRPVHLTPSQDPNRRENNFIYDQDSCQQLTSGFSDDPQAVSILKSIPPKLCFRPRHVIIGILALNWIDISLNLSVLTHLYTKINAQVATICTKLTVKNSQLTGPIMSGPYGFFYDGYTSPFVAIHTIIYQVCLGIGIGCLFLLQHSYIILLKLILVTFTLGYTIYFLSDKGFRRGTDHLAHSLMIFFHATTVLVAFLASVAPEPIMEATFKVFGFSELLSERKTAVAGVLVGLFILLSLTTFQLIVIVCAFFYRQTDDTKGLRVIPNCNLIIADDSSRYQAWTVDVPGFIKCPILDLRVQCNIIDVKELQVSVTASGEEPSIQLHVLDILQEIQTAQSLSSPIPRPPIVLSLFLPDQKALFGYQHLNVSNRSSVAFAHHPFCRSEVYQKVVNFLQNHPVLKYMAENIASSIHHQASLVGSHGTDVFSMTLVPPSIKHHKKRMQLLDPQA